MATPGTFREGGLRRQALFVLLVGVFVCGLGIAVQDKVLRVGRPDVGWTLDGPYLSPTRQDASDAGLRGGGRLLELNGEPFEPRTVRERVPAGARSGLGQVNVLRLLTPRGDVRELRIPVRRWRWQDAVFTQGAIDVLGILFAILGVSIFLLRPWEEASWALLALTAIPAGLLTTQFVPFGPAEPLKATYFLTVASVACVVPLHAAFAFPVVHPTLARRRWPLLCVYGLGLLGAALTNGAWHTGGAGPFAYARLVTTALLAVSFAAFIGRSALLALRGREPVVRQRARILVVGAVFGLAPIGLVNFAQIVLGAFPLDIRFAYWMLGVFFLSLAHVTVRQELTNARIAVRRGLIYAAVVGVLTLAAVGLVAVSPYAVALLILPLLYVWPRFDARLDAWLYPKRSRFPELLRAIGGELAGTTTVPQILDVLAGAPGRLCDARSCVALLFEGSVGPSAELAAVGLREPPEPKGLADEPLLQLVVTTRKEVFRSRIAIEPQYGNIAEESHACCARLGAEVVLPILGRDRAIGVLAIGPRATGDPYEAAELEVLSTVVQLAVQAITRAQAARRLQEREREFADLKRFFPAPVIDQVLARGGAAELGSKRRLVTVFFSDLRGFTAFAETVEPEEVMATLAEFHDAMGRRVSEFAGTLERFAGDGFLVVFNDPVEQPDHVERAVRMALAMRGDAAKLRERWEQRGYRIDVGMGIHTGYATCGFVGYEGRRDYGVIGNVTNLAARLSDAAPGGEILVTARVRAELGARYEVEPAGALNLKGLSQPQEAFRVVASA